MLTVVLVGLAVLLLAASAPGVVILWRRHRRPSWPEPVWVVSTEAGDWVAPPGVPMGDAMEACPFRAAGELAVHAIVGRDSDGNTARVWSAAAFGEVGHGQGARDMPIAYVPLFSPDFCARCDVRGYVGRDLIGVEAGSPEYRCRDRRACERRQRVTA